MTLLVLLVIVVAAALLEAVLGALAILLAVAALAIAFMASFAFLPWWLALGGWLVLAGLSLRASRRNARRRLEQFTEDCARIRELERLADTLSLPFDKRADLQRQAFDLRCRLHYWDGFP